MPPPKPWRSWLGVILRATARHPFPGAMGPIPEAPAKRRPRSIPRNRSTRSYCAATRLSSRLGKRPWAVQRTHSTSFTSVAKSPRSTTKGLSAEAHRDDAGRNPWQEQQWQQQQLEQEFDQTQSYVPPLLVLARNRRRRRRTGKRGGRTHPERKNVWRRQQQRVWQHMLSEARAQARAEVARRVRDEVGRRSK